MDHGPHKSVLLHELIEGLSIAPEDAVLDATLGGGGHAAAASALLREGGILVGIDLDARALARAKERLAGGRCRVCLRQENFRNLDKVLATCGLSSIDAAYFDLGVRSEQIEHSGRGMSFERDEPLLMTFSDRPAEGDLTASEIVNEWQQESIADVLYGFGGERYSRRIARALVEHRPIKTTRELVSVIENAVPGRYRTARIHCATRTFQALRIAVNDELGALSEGLSKAYAHLEASGRIGVITFHSGEDRIVKRFFRERAELGGGTIVTKKPIVPSKEETAANPRARSAKLRIFQKNHGEPDQ